MIKTRWAIMRSEDGAWASLACDQYLILMDRFTGNGKTTESPLMFYGTHTMSTAAPVLKKLSKVMNGVYFTWRNDVFLLKSNRLFAIKCSSQKNYDNLKLELIV